jgi:hypothetical protein
MIGRSTQAMKHVGHHKYTRSNRQQPYGRHASGARCPKAKVEDR